MRDDAHTTEGCDLFGEPGTRAGDEHEVLGNLQAFGQRLDVFGSKPALRKHLNERLSVAFHMGPGKQYQIYLQLRVHLVEYFNLFRKVLWNVLFVFIHVHDNHSPIE